MEENNFEKLASALFGSYKKSLISLFAIAIVLAIPITINLVQQQQDLRQEAASDYPTGYSMTLSPSTADPTKNPIITTTITSNAESGQFTGLRRYIFFASTTTSVPTPGTASIADPYNPSTIQNYKDKIVALDTSQLNTSSPPGFATPQTAGTYYVLINYYGNGYTCAWDGTLVKPDGTKGTCVNAGKQILTVTTSSGTTASTPVVSVTAIQTAAFTNNPSQGYTTGAQAKITTIGTGESIGTYIFRSADGNPPNPSISYTTNQSYPSGSLTPNQFYKISAANSTTVSQTITLPPDAGKYYLVANAHSQTLENWWTPKLPTQDSVAPDYVCSWDSRLLVNTNTAPDGKDNPTLQVQNGNGTACNIGPQLLTVNAIGTSTSTTPTGTIPVTQPTSPTGGVNPTSSVSPTQSTTTSNNQLAVAVQLPGIGSNTGDNPNPKNSTRDVEVWVYNTNNTIVKDITGKVTFDGINTYKGTVDLGNDFQSGYYYVKLRLNNTLKKAVPGVVQINANGIQPTPTTQGSSPSNTSTDPCASLPYPKSSSTYIYQCELLKLRTGGIGGVLAANVTQLPTVTLVPGDLDPNQDNTLDIKDYNMFISCYGSKSCNEKQQADFNDDGVVDGKDYNILARGFAIRQGD